MNVLAFLLKRPIAVFITFLALAIGGAISLINLPVSLMPESETPQLRIEVEFPDGSPMFIERSIMENLRIACQGLLGIENVSSVAASSSGQLILTYQYGTDMKRAYIEANEKIDQTVQFLPGDMERPVVRRVLQTDIPVVRLQLTSDKYSLLELTRLARNIMKRRLEQLEGVSLVEWNGAVKEVIRVTPDRTAMLRYQISESQLMQRIAANNTEIAQIKVNEGLYQFDLTFENVLEDPENLQRIKIFGRDGLPVVLSELATIEKSIAKPIGSHWFEGKPGIVFAIHKRESADFNQLETEILKVQEQMRNEYPGIYFDTTQSQSKLLNNSIQQLGTSLLLGIVLASVILLIFSSNYRSSVLMILLIPMAMLLCFSVLKVFGLSINIITLSGMILGVGILIDNGIILIDHIKLKMKDENLFDACVKGTVEIIPALISSAGTTLCVFIPLIFLEGIGGSLFQQQAFTFSVVLLSSLVVTFLFLPLLYLKLNPSDRGENALFSSLTRWYSAGQNSKTERIFGFSFLILIAFGSWTYLQIPQEPLPEIKTSDAQISLTWGEVMTLPAQEETIASWMSQLEGLVSWESDVGNNEIYEQGIPGIEKALIYIRFSSPEFREKGLKRITSWISNDFPKTFVETSRAKNPYDQLLGNPEPFAAFDLRVVGNSLIETTEIEYLDTLDLSTGLGFQSQKGFELSFNYDRLNALGLSQEQFINPLKTQFGDQLITTVNLVNRSIPIVIRGSQKMDQKALGSIWISLNDTISFPLGQFIHIKEVEVPRYITADESGIYQSLEIKESTPNLGSISSRVRGFAMERGWLMSVRGSFERIEGNLRYLILSFLVVIMLLFAILAAQFESLTKPLIILAEIPVSLSGSLIFLWVFKQSLNLSSMMGIIIMLGIIVNDSILKVDSINRYLKKGKPRDDAIKQAGADRLKPILMTTLTTILALLPILWSTGLGSDIQIPLCIAVIGGLFIGTICSLYLVPFLYRMLTPQTIVT